MKVWRKELHVFDPPNILKAEKKKKVVVKEEKEDGDPDEGLDFLPFDILDE